MSIRDSNGDLWISGGQQLSWMEVVLNPEPQAPTLAPTLSSSIQVRSARQTQAYPPNSRPGFSDSDQIKWWDINWGSSEDEMSMAFDFPGPEPKRLPAKRTRLPSSAPAGRSSDAESKNSLINSATIHPIGKRKRSSLDLTTFEPATGILKTSQAPPVAAQHTKMGDRTSQETQSSLDGRKRLKPTICRTCGLQVSTPRALIVHINTVCSTPYTCPKCRRTQVEGVRRHKRSCKVPI